MPALPDVRAGSLARCLVAGLALAGLSSCWSPGVGEDAAGVVHQRSRRLMGTEFQVMVYAEAGRADAGPALDASLDEVARLEALLSEFRPTSQVSRLNQAAGGDAISMDPDVLALLGRSVDLCRRTGGVFDPTFPPLGKVWDFKQVPFVAPGPEELEEARSLVGCQLVELDQETGTARLPVEGMAIGLGGLAKGTAVDSAARILRERGFPDLLVDGGGDTLAMGSKGEEPWRVGIQHPRMDRGLLLGSLPVEDRALVTSGDYERFQEVGGQRVHHVIDPRTGRPASGAVAVTVMAAEAELADGLATALLVAGPAEAPGLLSEFPGVDALLLGEEGEAWLTDGFEALMGLGSPASSAPSALDPIGDGQLHEPGAFRGLQP